MTKWAKLYKAERIKTDKVFWLLLPAYVHADRFLVTFLFLDNAIMECYFNIKRARRLRVNCIWIIVKCLLDYAMDLKKSHAGWA